MTDTTAEGTGGLIGAMGRSLARTRDRIVSTLGNHDAWAIRLVFIGGFITILHKAGVPIPQYAMWFAICLGVAALLYEMNAATYALRSFWNGKLAGTIGWSFVWLVAFAYSMNQWIGAAGENEGVKSNVHKAAFVATQNADDALKSAKAELGRIDLRLGWMNTAVNGQPVRNLDAVDADIAAAMAKDAYKASNSCLSPNRKNEKFCASLSALKAEKALASELATLNDERPGAKAAYDAALSAKSNTKTEVSEARNDLLIMTKYLGMKEDDARTLNALGSIVAISIFLSVATMLRELEHLRATRQRRPIFGNVFVKLYHMLTGKLPAGTSVHTYSREVVERDRLIPTSTRDYLPRPL